MKTWAYLVIFDDELGTRTQVQEFLDSLPEVKDWYACIPHCVFFTSTATAGGIAEDIQERFGKGAGRFMVVEVHSDRQGWLPKRAWKMFRNPEDPDAEDDS